MLVSPSLVQVPNQWSLVPCAISVTTVGKDKGDSEVKAGAVHRPLSIYLMAEETPENLS